jgi:hypothetical protein
MKEAIMKNDINESNIQIVSNTQTSEDIRITKKISFKRETLRNLVTIASREYFDSKMKQDDMLAEMLDKVINEYYNNWKINNI